MDTLLAANDNAELEPLRLELRVEDPQSLGLLYAVEEGRPRQTHAHTALRIGLLALEQARGQIDVDAVRREGQRILELMDQRMTAHNRELHNRVEGTVSEYFDPQSGRVAERFRGLLEQDGELDRVLQRSVGANGSDLARTLAEFVGEQSPLVRMLDPEAKEGLVTAVRDLLDEQLKLQRETVLRELSLDNKDGALRRLIEELESRHGKLETLFGEKVEVLVQELSADVESSALNRLMKHVETAQQTITAQFSLDNETSALARLKQQLDQTRNAINAQLTLDDDASPLSRLRRELLDLHETQRTTAEKFQNEVTQILSELAGKRAAEREGTQHGHAFEDLVVGEVSRRAREQGHLPEATGDSTGRIRNCKKGDMVVELGPDHTAAGARIVLEAKEDGSYTLKKARDEIAAARSNRDADIGLFVFSTLTAPADLPRFQRLGDDIFVVLDPRDPDGDIVLDCSLAVATGLCARRAQASESVEADLAAIDKAILDVEKRAAGFDEIHRLAGTIKNNSEKILKRADLDRQALRKRVEELQLCMAALRGVVGA